MSPLLISVPRNARVPSHRHGRLVNWQKEQSGNPTGKMGEYHEVRRIDALRLAQPEAFQ